jgi:hypothetical protein
VITMGTDEPVGVFAGILTLTCITPETISSRTRELRAYSAVSEANTEAVGPLRS